MPAVAQAIEHFNCKKGEDYTINWTVQTSETDATAINITGWTFSMKVKRKNSDADPSEITPTITIITAASGRVDAVFAAADTVLMEGDYVYSFWRTNSGAASCLCSGIFSVVDTTQN
jgi:hypothetical protein